MFCRPLTSDWPLVSMARLSTAGFVPGKFDGAIASSRPCTMNRAFSRSLASRSAASSRSWVAFCHSSNCSRSQKNPALSVQEASANRLSFASGTPSTWVPNARAVAA